jgi:hypothetical protein
MLTSAVDASVAKHGAHCPAGSNNTAGLLAPVCRIMKSKTAWGSSSTTTRLTARASVARCCATSLPLPPAAASPS